MVEIPDEHLVNLFVDSVAGRITESGHRELADWAGRSPAREFFYADFQKPAVGSREMEIYTRYDPQKGYTQWKQQQRRKKQLVYYIRTAAAAVVFGTLGLWWILRSDVRKEAAPPAVVDARAMVVQSMESTPLSAAGNNKSDVVRILPDGTRVWLNSGTTVFYPARFTGSERVVELNGEAYFEVAHDQRPFSVSLPGGARVQALGTSFNVMAYRGEESIQATLLEGVINVQKAGMTVLLKPGQQISATQDSGGLSAPQEVDGNKIIEWKENVFHFPEHSNLNMVLRRIARWYGLRLVYEVKVSEEQEYKGDIQRSLPLKDILDHLLYKGIKFTISDGRLIVGADRST